MPVRGILCIWAARSLPPVLPWPAGPVLVTVLLALYFGVFYAQAMRREEWELREQYGKTFDDYATTVPRFWPKFGVEPSLNGNRFSFAQYVRNREYQATIGAALLIAVLAALATWRR